MAIYRRQYSPNLIPTCLLLSFFYWPTQWMFAPVADSWYWIELFEAFFILVFIITIKGYLPPIESYKQN
jgi:hypothetical protein